MNKDLEEMMKKLSKGVKVMAVPEESMPISEGGEGFSLGSFIQKYSDVLIAVTLVMIVIMMIIPLPTALLDVLICFNITIALVVVMSAIYNEEALDLSVFPSLLLVTTLFRLALNISSTRLITYLHIFSFSSLVNLVSARYALLEMALITFWTLKISLLPSFLIT